MAALTDVEKAAHWAACHAESRLGVAGRPVTLQSRAAARDWSVAGQHKRFDVKEITGLVV